MQLGIRSRAILWLAMLGALIAAVVYPFGIRTLDQNFREFEQHQIETDSERIRLALVATSDRLRVVARDYGHWNQTMDYVAGRDPTFITDNIYVESLENLGADFAFLIDREGRVVWTGAIPAESVDDEGADLVEVPADRVAKYTARASFERTRADISAVSDFVWVGDTCHLLAISSISDDKSVEFGGWLVFGKVLDSSYLRMLSAQTQSRFTLAAATRADWEGEPTRVEIDEDRFSARRLLLDDVGDPVLSIDTRGPRPLAGQQAKAQQLLLAAVLLTVVVGLTLTYAILHFIVIRRVKSLGEWARDLRDAKAVGTYDHYVRRARPDELDLLHDDFVKLTQELERVTEQWRAQAWEDWLTGVGNRARLVHDLGQHRSAEGSASPSASIDALLLVDMDNFKAVNDLMGHLSGDELLREVARRIRATVPQVASVYRLGGDEFAVWWRRAPNAASIEALATELLRELRINHRSIEVSASIGIEASNNGTALADELLMRADIALYTAKQAGRDRYRHYAREDFERFREQFDIDSLLRAAIKADGIELHYQPIVDARTGRVEAVEALARWFHPERGRIEPASFIVAAERAHLIQALDALVLRKSSEALARLRSRFPGLCMNINVSAISLQDGSFLNALRGLLDRGAIVPGALRLELTESGLATGAQALAEAAAVLREMGVALVIDDFGAGASSLNRLDRLQPAGLKLDGSFVRDFDGAGGRICRAIVDLARGLAVPVTAEFVETEAQQHFLQRIGCESLQGYHFSAPLAEDALVPWIAAFRGKADGEAILRSA